MLNQSSQIQNTFSFGKFNFSRPPALTTLLSSNTQTTYPPNLQTKSTEALIVPPVASTSSSSTILSPLLIFYFCNSIVSSPYSNLQLSFSQSPGNLPALRMGQQPLPVRRLRAGAKRNPLDYSIKTLSYSTVDNLWAKVSMTNLKMGGLAMMGKMSIKSTFFLKLLQVLVASLIFLATASSTCMLTKILDNSLRLYLSQIATPVRKPQKQQKHHLFLASIDYISHKLNLTPNTNSQIYFLFADVLTQFNLYFGIRVSLARLELYPFVRINNKFLSQLLKMWHKYDIESDQLKCNFCTQWFKCTLHYANLQRYSLKACQKCLCSFTYTLLHPETYRIYKVLLLDSNIVIDQQTSQAETPQNQALLQLQSAEQEAKDKLGLHFEEQIKRTIQEMEKVMKRVDETVKGFKEQIKSLGLIKLQELTKDSKELMTRINNMKERSLDLWLKQPEKIDKKIGLVRNASAYLGHSRKYSYHAEKQKENNNPNREAFCKTIKNKVAGLQDSKVRLKDPHYLDLPPLYHQRPKSLSKSSQNSQSRKRLNASVLLSSLGSHQERDLTQVINLLDVNEDYETYLPFEIHPQNSMMVKNESKRTQADAIIDLRGRTAKGGELVQLIGADITKINFQCYLKSLGTQPAAKTIRIIKAGLTDYEFDALLRFLSQHPNIQTLIVTNNRLTEVSLVALQSFLAHNTKSSLKHVYLGSNRIVRERTTLACKILNQYGVQVCL